MQQLREQGAMHSLAGGTSGSHSASGSRRGLHARAMMASTVAASLETDSLGASVPGMGMLPGQV